MRCDTKVPRRLLPRLWRTVCRTLTGATKCDRYQDGIQKHTAQQLSDERGFSAPSRGQNLVYPVHHPKMITDVLGQPPSAERPSKASWQKGRKAEKTGWVQGMLKIYRDILDTPAPCAMDDHLPPIPRMRSTPEHRGRPPLSMTLAALERLGACLPGGQQRGRRHLLHVVPPQPAGRRRRHDAVVRRRRRGGGVPLQPRRRVGRHGPPPRGWPSVPSPTWPSPSRCPAAGTAGLALSGWPHIMCCAPTNLGGAPPETC